MSLVRAESAPRRLARFYPSTAVVLLVLSQFPLVGVGGSELRLHDLPEVGFGGVLLVAAFVLLIGSVAIAGWYPGEATADLGMVVGACGFIVTARIAGMTNGGRDRGVARFGRHPRRHGEDPVHAVLPSGRLTSAFAGRDAILPGEDDPSSSDPPPTEGNLR